MKQTVTLPLPPRTASPNYKPLTVRDRIHRSDDIAAYRALCKCAYRIMFKAVTGPVTLHLEYVMPSGLDSTQKWRVSDRYKPLDRDNAVAAFKAGRDALVDAGIIPNDTAKYVGQTLVTLSRPKKPGPHASHIVLTIEENAVEYQK